MLYDNIVQDLVPPHNHSDLTSMLFEKILEFIDNDKNQFQIKDNQYKKFLKKTNFLHFLTKKFFPSLLKNSFFLEMDFSVAKNNYFRER